MEQNMPSGKRQSPPTLTVKMPERVVAQPSQHRADAHAPRHRTAGMRVCVRARART